jgi:hypothetical protein
VSRSSPRLGWGRCSLFCGVLQRLYLDFAGLAAPALAAGLAVASRTSLIFSRLAMRARRNLFSRDRSPLRYDMDFLSGAGGPSTFGPLIRSEADPQLGA